MAMSNMAIARMHRASRKFVAHTIALATMLGFLLSGLVILGGVTVYAVITFPLPMGQWVIAVWVGAGIIGLLLAVLTEALTLGACARLRHKLEVRTSIHARYSQIDSPTLEVLTQKRVELHSTVWVIGTSVVFILIGSAISVAAGTLLWHMLLSALPVWQAWGFSTLFSCIVCVTLVVGELAKRTNNSVIEESIVADTFLKQAAYEDSREQVIDQLAKQHNAAITSATTTETFHVAIAGNAETIVDQVLTNGDGSIPMRIERERTLKQLEVDRNKATTTRQLQIVRGETTSLASTGTARQRRDGEKNYNAIATLVSTMGESYVRQHVHQLASQYGITPSTIYRHLRTTTRQTDKHKAIN